MKSIQLNLTIEQAKDLRIVLKASIDNMIDMAYHTAKTAAEAGTINQWMEMWIYPKVRLEQIETNLLKELSEKDI